MLGNPIDSWYCFWWNLFSLQLGYANSCLKLILLGNVYEHINVTDSHNLAEYPNLIQEEHFISMVCSFTTISNLTFEGKVDYSFLKFKVGL